MSHGRLHISYIPVTCDSLGHSPRVLALPVRSQHGRSRSRSSPEDGDRLCSGLVIAYKRGRADLMNDELLDAAEREGFAVLATTDTSLRRTVGQNRLESGGHHPAREAKPGSLLNWATSGAFGAAAVVSSVADSGADSTVTGGAIARGCRSNADGPGRRLRTGRNQRPEPLLEGVAERNRPADPACLYVNHYMHGSPLTLPVSPT